MPLVEIALNVLLVFRKMFLFVQTKSLLAPLCGGAGEGLGQTRKLSKSLLHSQALFHIETGSYYVAQVALGPSLQPSQAFNFELFYVTLACNRASQFAPPGLAVAHLLALES